MTRLLFRHVPPDRRGTAFTQFVEPGGGRLWSTHTEALQRTISRQRDERFEQELLLAKSIQQRLLPRRVPPIPGFDVAGRVLAAREVGGDYWSVKEYPDDGVVTFKLADVTGHGIAAATLVAAVKFISGGFYRGAQCAAEVMERTNHVLVKETPSEIMIPMVMAGSIRRPRRPASSMRARAVLHLPRGRPHRGYPADRAGPGADGDELREVARALRARGPVVRLL